MSVTRIKNSSIKNKGPKYDNVLAGLPYTPTIGTATDGGTGSTATVAFTANGNPAGLTYTALSTPGSFTGTGTTSPITVTGLSSGTAYTFQVNATNANGTSAYSSASNSVTPASPSSFESIATISGSGVSTITFSSIPSTYKSLQIRAIGLLPDGSNLAMRFNGDTASNYVMHYLMGNGASASASSSGGAAAQISNVCMTNNSTTYPGVSVIDIIDYASTSKYKTSRHFTGTEDNNTQGFQSIRLGSGLWMSTSAVTSITIFNTSSTNGGTGTSFALYGIKG